VYGNRKPKENEICVFFKSGAAVILDFEKYDRTSRINKLNAITKESLITEFKNSSEPTNRQGILIIFLPSYFTLSAIFVSAARPAVRPPACSSW